MLSSTREQINLLRKLPTPQTTKVVKIQQKVEPKVENITTTKIPIPSPPLPSPPLPSPPLPSPSPILELNNSLINSLVKKPIRTIVSFYLDKDDVRNNEIQICLKNNAFSFVEQHIVCENTSDSIIAKTICPNAIIHTLDKRPNYSKMIEIVQEGSTKDCIFILMNSDIELTESIALLNDFDFSKNTIGLLRWEITDSDITIDFSKKDSQDVWCWSGILDYTICIGR
jgi:hypothetical protein